MVRIITTAWMILAVFLFTSRASADIWMEVGDAGNLPATAQVPVGTDPLTAIFGTIVGTGATSDVDMYRIFISNPTLFSATTVNLFGTLSDTQLFLFDSAGFGVYANDDANPIAPGRSTLPAGSGVGPMSAGIYYLAISSFDRDPVSSGGLIFPSFPFTDVFGPTGPGGGSPVSGYAGSGVFQGTYRIDLTGAQFAGDVNVVPEPSSLVLLSAGAVGLLGCVWRHRRARRKAYPLADLDRVLPD